MNLLFMYRASLNRETQSVTSQTTSILNSIDFKLVGEANQAYLLNNNETKDIR